MSFIVSEEALTALGEAIQAAAPEVTGEVAVAAPAS